MKFNRAYRLEVEVAGGQKVTLELPYAVEFNISRQNLANSQTATITLFNLSERLRDLIYKDRFDTVKFRAVQLWAGYDGELSRVFNGTIFEAYSVRQGTDYRTTLECFDGAYAMLNAFSNLVIGEAATAKEVLNYLNADLALAGVSDKAIIGDYSSRFVRPSVYLGNTWNYIVQLTDGLATIDNNTLLALKSDEVIESTLLPVISSDSGLLGSPKRSGTNIIFSMIFEPRLVIGQVLRLQSVSNSLFNGTYKVAGFDHRAIISTTVSGQAVTEVNLWKGEVAFKTVAEVAA